MGSEKELWLNQNMECFIFFPQRWLCQHTQCVLQKRAPFFVQFYSSQSIFHLPEKWSLGALWAVRRDDKNLGNEDWKILRTLSKMQQHSILNKCLLVPLPFQYNQRRALLPSSRELPFRPPLDHVTINFELLKSRPDVVNVPCGRSIIIQRFRDLWWIITNRGKNVDLPCKKDG